MPVPRPLLLAAVSATITLAFLLAGAPAVASAAVAPGAGRTAYGPPPGTARSSSAVSPSGCVQTADYPHQSTHVPGTTNGVVRTVCRVYIPRISETAQMWESRWWGWDRVGHKGSVTDIDSKAASVNASDVCRNNTVRVTGSGSIVDVDGRTYYASTESIHVKNPCHL